MKYFSLFKRFMFIALICSFAAQGGNVGSHASRKNLQNIKNSTVYNISVSAGQARNSQASANLTMSGENSKVSVEKEGTVTLVAGKSILLHPGTKISSGGFLYASIEPMPKSGKHQKKEVRIVTVEEKNKIEEQASLSTAYSLFSPFPTRNKGHLHTGDAENGSFTSSINDLSGVAPEQHRKVAVNSFNLTEITREQMVINYKPVPETYTFRAETMMVLRL